MHPNSIKLFDIYAKPHFKDGMRVVEIAPNNPSRLKEAVANRSIRWESINLAPPDDRYVVPMEGLTFLATKPYEYPIPDDSYDIVVSSNVLEHVPMPWRWMKELARICKPTGRVITVAPLNWGYHAEPVDCWRAYPDGMRAVYEDAGLQVETVLIESTDTWRTRANVDGIKYLVKWLIRWPLKGKPLFAWDTLCVGIKPAA
jgi:SAM-dependent methyltransferase